MFHINGRSPFAGDHQGFVGFVEVFSNLMGAVDSYRQEVLDVTASDQHSMGLLTSTVQRGDQQLTTELVTVLTWRDGKVVDERIITLTRTPQTPSTPDAARPGRAELAVCPVR